MQFPLVTIPPSEPFVTILPPRDPCAPVRQQVERLEQALGQLNQFTQVALREYRQSQEQNALLQVRIAQLEQLAQAPRTAQLEAEVGQLNQSLQAAVLQNRALRSQQRSLEETVSTTRSNWEMVQGALVNCRGILQQ